MTVEPPRTRPEAGVMRALVRLALPVVGLNVLQVLALAVDTAMVGRLGEDAAALTGLGFATQLVFLLMVGMIGLTVGVVAFLARAHGAGDRARVLHIVGQATWLTVGLGLVVAVAGNLLARWMLGVLGARGEDLDNALAYLRPALTGCVFTYLSLLYAALLRGVGNTVLPFRVALFTNTLNALLNYGLILGGYGFPALGIMGASIGTVTSHAVGVYLLTRAIRSGQVTGIGLDVRVGRLDWDLARDVFRVGWPASADMVVLNAGFLTIVGLLGRIEPVAVAAHGVGLRVQGLAFVPGLAIAQATGAMVGNALGAGDVERARAIVRASLVLCTGVMTALAVVILVAARPILLVFDVQPATRLGELGVQWMTLLGACMPIVGVWIAYVGMFQGSGATRTSLAINALATLLFQIPLSFLLGLVLGWGPWGVWVAFPASFVVKAALGTVAWRRGRWARPGVRA